MIDKQELAWAAGFFDGEGCFSVDLSANRRLNPRAKINQVDPEVLHRFHAAVGYGKIRINYTLAMQNNSNHQSQWQWYCQKNEEVLAVYFALFPYLGTVKRVQGARMMDAYFNPPPRKNKWQEHLKNDLDCRCLGCVSRRP